MTYLIGFPHAAIQKGSEVVTASSQDDLVRRDPLPLHDQSDVRVLWREA